MTSIDSSQLRRFGSGPEKAGVGGSIPSLATILFNNLQIAKNIEISLREPYANIAQAAFALSLVGSSNFHISRAVLWSWQYAAVVLSVSADAQRVRHAIDVIEPGCD